MKIQNMAKFAAKILLDKNYDGLFYDELNHLQHSFFCPDDYQEEAEEFKDIYEDSLADLQVYVSNFRFS